ncbi:MAG: sigma-54 dependent transcriptional regulator [Thermodesulfobacteriota bacterium]|nr:MAG: sigma-54 dependent transcriptional regulator [Thermodesulfobacteriota bacterium]
MGMLWEGGRFKVGEEMRRPVVLIVDDEEQIRRTLTLLLDEYYETISVPDAMQAIEVVRSKGVDIVLMDINLPEMDGIEALEKIRKVDPDVGVVMLSASDSARQAVSALKKGAYDYITKPFEYEDLLSTLKRYSDRLDLKSEVAYLKEELSSRTPHGMITTRSPAMNRIFDLIERVGQAASNVLITGESGTGKELVARAIHSMGNRSKKPFVPVNCGAVPAELMESELFGHEKGSFTGAHARKIGKFEYAHGGTIFLDEVATLPLALQVKLLRVLQEKTFERVGSNFPITVDIRVISATNVDLEKEVREGHFREDLYYRLKVVPVELPPLRERKEDIPLLVSHFLRIHCRTLGRPVLKISKEAVDLFMRYSWPGNIRELENFIERLVVLSKDGGELTIEDLPMGMFYSDADTDENNTEGEDFREALRGFERRFIMKELARANWNRMEAARRMHMHRNTLLMKMKELKIKQPRH